jgi:hypothetical protein
LEPLGEEKHPETNALLSSILFFFAENGKSLSNRDTNLRLDPSTPKVSLEASCLRTQVFNYFLSILNSNFLLVMGWVPSSLIINFFI